MRAGAPGIFAAFRTRSYRFQWCADLLTSWSFEMETLILGWYVLVVTDSPFVLAALGSLHYGGTLLSPFFGVVADRVSRRTMLVVMRVTYAGLAATIMILGLGGEVAPWQLFVVVAVSGLVRPSDLVVRQSLIADTVPADTLRNAMGLARTTMDSARIAGALLGAGLLSTLGIGPAYGAVTGFYLTSALLTFGVAAPRQHRGMPAHPWHELRLGLRYMRGSQTIVGCMCLAFLVNLTAYPVTHGLLPVVARDVYGVDANGLARLVAAYASGALAGSILTATAFRATHPGRTMAACTLVWYLTLIGMGHTSTPVGGSLLLFVAGTAQSFAMIALVVMLLGTAEETYRGRVLGVRMLAVYGLPLGLLAAGALVEATSVPVTFTVYGVAGVALTTATLARWPGLLAAGSGADGESPASTEATTRVE